jgi:hypothetical protein
MADRLRRRAFGSGSTFMVEGQTLRSVPPDILDSLAAGTFDRCGWRGTAPIRVRVAARHSPAAARPFHFGHVAAPDRRIAPMHPIPPIRPTGCRTSPECCQSRYSMLFPQGRCRGNERRIWPRPANPTHCLRTGAADRLRQACELASGSPRLARRPFRASSSSRAVEPEFFPTRAPLPHAEHGFLRDGMTQQARLG